MIREMRGHDIYGFSDLCRAVGWHGDNTDHRRHCTVCVVTKFKLLRVK